MSRYGPTTPFGLLYSINPAIIIVAVPFVMALTQGLSLSLSFSLSLSLSLSDSLAFSLSGYDPLKQIKFGTLIAGLSPFWIALFPNYFGAVLFSITLSVGESIYSPKTYPLCTLHMQRLHST